MCSTAGGSHSTVGSTGDVQWLLLLFVLLGRGVGRHLDGSAAANSGSVSLPPAAWVRPPALPLENMHSWRLFTFLDVCKSLFLLFNF